MKTINYDLEQEKVAKQTSRLVFAQLTVTALGSGPPRPNWRKTTMTWHTKKVSQGKALCS